ncbi:hypothetical protein ZWY2020_005928 [Hordeum vulgare]|nr:hypothetical protein ZWY2020_005928 [Hordeum vulgare]
MRGASQDARRPHITAFSGPQRAGHAGGGDPPLPKGTPGPRSRGTPRRRTRSSTTRAGEPPRDQQGAPSNMVRSESPARSSRISPPPTPTEALKRAQLLLDFPPSGDKQREWRATIHILLAVADGDEPRQAGTSKRPSSKHTRDRDEKTRAPTATVHSPPRWRERVIISDDSTGSSDPRHRRDQRDILCERREEDAPTLIERRCETRRQSDMRAAFGARFRGIL